MKADRRPYMRQWREDNSEHVRAYARDQWLKRMHGLTRAEWDAMVILQNGRCAICAKELAGRNEPVLDHNHTNGAIRELTCNNCNLAIGLVKEDPTIVDRLAAYLRHHRRRAAAARRVRIFKRPLPKAEPNEKPQ